MAKKNIPPILGFFEDFDMDSVAEDVRNLKSSPEVNFFESPKKSVDHRVSNFSYSSPIESAKTSHRQNVTSPGTLTESETEGHTVSSADSQRVNTADSHNVISSGVLTLTASDGHDVRTSHGQKKKVSRSGITNLQARVLSWLIQECGSKNSIVTYRMGSIALSVTERAIRTHIEALEKRNYIVTQVAFRPNSCTPIGKLISINPSAHLALALVKSQGDFSNVPQVASLRQIDTTSDRQRVTMSEDLTIQASDGQTICSSSFNNTTTKELFENHNIDSFDELILDEWQDWGLKQNLISRYLSLDMSTIQDILDKTAYVIRKKEKTQFAIQNRIGFLKKCLQQEFCEVDNEFVSRKEQNKLRKIEQLKKEAERLRILKEEEQNAAIDVVKIGLSDDELELLKYNAKESIKKELKNPSMQPNESMIQAYERKLLIQMAKDKKII